MPREKEIRKLILQETEAKGWKTDRLTAKSEDYDFIKCVEQYESLAEYRKNFTPFCDDLSLEECSCEECWRSFMNGTNKE